MQGRLAFAAPWLAVVLVAIAALPAARGADDRGDGQVETRDGELRLRWNEDLLRALGLRLERGAALGTTEGYAVYALRSSDSAHWTVRGNSITALERGSWRLSGGPALHGRRRTLSLVDARLVVVAGTPSTLALRGSDGAPWFVADHLMLHRPEDGDQAFVRSADLRVSAALAAKLGREELANWVVGGLALAAPIQRETIDKAAKDCGNPNWPGEPAPAGGTYRADVFLANLAGQFVRCRQSTSAFTCNGPGGDDGLVVFAPSATLVNNFNQGSAVETISGDPLGTSTALWTADVPWYTKFQPGSPFPPYNNDQHPFLVWNLYRLDADGALTQIGRSGAKHAFATSNEGAQCDGCNGNNILGRACLDTYPIDSNEFSQALGPRSELIAASGRWGRCGSIYDADCNSEGDTPPVGNYDYRMVVNESEVDPAVNPGATFLLEVWYVVRDDIQIYNTMGTKAATFTWQPQPLVWNMATASPLRLGPAIDRWIAPGSGPGVRNAELASTEGHAKVAVRATDLGNGNWRYDFAVMNFDFARAVTQGTEPNLRVLANHGFDRIELARSPDAPIVSTTFIDGDAVAGNDWTATVEAERVRFDAPDAAASLDWGSLYRFSVVAGAAPGSGEVRLRVTEPGSPGSYGVSSFSIGALQFFADGFED